MHEIVGKLQRAEYWLSERREILEKPNEWHSLLIDYERPIVERVWLQLEPDVRLMLHRIHPCEQGKAYLHPHNWPGAVRILAGGAYEMNVGFGSGNDRPDIAGTMILNPGDRCWMTSPDMWHSVRPLGSPSLSIMVIGKPWGKRDPASAPHPLKELDRDHKLNLLHAFYEEHWRLKSFSS